MQRIRFLSDQVYDTGGPGKGPRFAAGSELSENEVGAALGEDVSTERARGFLRRWVSRGVAVDVDGIAAPEPEPAPETADLDRMSRADLDVLAADRGIDPAAYRTKADLIAALAAPAAAG